MPNITNKPALMQSPKSFIIPKSPKQKTVLTKHSATSKQMYLIKKLDKWIPLKMKQNNYTINEASFLIFGAIGLQKQKITWIIKEKNKNKLKKD